MTPSDFLPAAQHPSLPTRWMDELGENLMWIGTAGEECAWHCTPNPKAAHVRLQGWSEVGNILDMVPSLLEIACPEKSGHVIIRTAEALYVVLCTSGEPRLVLGIDPSFPLAKLGFA